MDKVMDKVMDKIDKDNRDEKYTYTARKAPEQVDLQVVWDCVKRG